MPEPYDLAIVGGGPAGIAAALAAAEHGLSIVVVDEQARPGGQILRQPPHQFGVANWLPGPAYRSLKANLARFEAVSEIEWRGQSSVAGLDREQSAEHFSLRLTGSRSAQTLTARRVLVAAGCYDLPVPLPGWTLPGVMSAGGVQAFMKSQQLVPGTRFVLAGTHPLMLIIAAQIVEAGGEVACVAFDQSGRRAMLALARHPWIALRHAVHLVTAQAALRVLRRANVPIRFGTPLEAIEGEGQVRAARFARAGSVACDTVALCFGFTPQSDLPRLAGAGISWAEPAGGWRTDHDAWMESNVSGLFVAGETTGVAGADIASLEGALAGIGIARAAGRLDTRQAEIVAGPLRKRLAKAYGFAAMLAEIADPREALARPISPDTILCRCEDVTYAKVDALGELRDPNAIKLQTRVGMGLCQGRSCEASLLRRIASLDHGHPAARGGFTARFPIRPVRIGDLLEFAQNATKPDELCD